MTTKPNMLHSRVHKTSGDQAMKFCLERLDFDTVLDICCGPGHHSDQFKAAGKTVTSVDKRDIYGQEFVGMYQDFEFVEHDLTWCCKALEHMLDTHSFLKKVRSETKLGGYTCMTVPPLMHDITGGHVSLWNAGLLMYHLVLAGFNCKNAHVKTYSYNISVIAQAADFELPELYYDIGDLELLQPWLPNWCVETFDGQILEYNWDE